MFGTNGVRLTLVLAVLAALLPAGGAWAAQDGRPAARAIFSPQAETPQSELDPQPIIAILADYFHVSAEDIQHLYDMGAGFGIIAEAYVLWDLGLTEMTPQDIIEAKLAGDLNWGQFLKEVDLQPGQTKLRLGDIVSGANRPDGWNPGAAGTSGGLGAPEQNQVQTQQQSQTQEQTGSNSNQGSEGSPGGDGSSSGGSGGSSTSSGGSGSGGSSGNGGGDGSGGSGGGKGK